MRGIRAGLAAALVGTTFAVALAVARAEDRKDAQGDPLPEGAVARLGTVRLRAHGPLAFAPDGLTLVAASEDGIRAFEVATGRVLWSAPGAGLRAFSAAFVPGGKELALGLVDGTTLFVAAGSGQRLRRFESLGNALDLVGNAVALAPDGKAFATPSRDGRIRLRESATGRVLRVFDTVTRGADEQAAREPDDTPRVALSPDGTELLATTARGAIARWRVSSGEALAPIEPPRGVSFGASFVVAPDGRTLAIGEGASSIACDAIGLFDLASGKEARRVTAPSSVYSLAFSPDAKVLAATLESGLAFFDVATGRAAGPALAVSGVTEPVFSPDGKKVAVGGESAIVLVDVGTRAPLPSPRGHDRAVVLVGFGADGKVVTADPRRVVRWSSDGELLGAYDVPFGVAPEGRSTLSPDGGVLASGDEGAIHRLEVATGKVLDPIASVGGKGWFPVAWSPDGRFLARAAERKGEGEEREVHEVQLWNAATGALERSGRVPEEAWGFAFAGDGKRLLVRSNGAWAVVSVPGLERAARIERSDDLGVLSPDGSTIALAGYSPEVVLWAVEDGRERARFQEGADVMALAFSPDGKRLAIGRRDGVVAVREVAGGGGRELRGHAGAVWALAFSVDGGRLVSGSEDTTALVWDVGATKAGGSR